MNYFLDSKRCLIAKGQTPERIPTVCTTKSVKGRLILGLVGGGVVLDAHQVTGKVPFRADPQRKLSPQRQEALAGTPAKPHPWWWD